ncbi:MAG: hypothetical protein EXS64_06145 [Candidatus Latescibacteria bacterium]|nr:hypothetical protein [Candidatus Latescibacterota bacterium]
MRDALRLRHPLHPPRIHLHAALDWLCRAQDATGCGGVSFAYGLKRGWHAPYPETTGYLIPTFYAAADHLGETLYADRAERMAAWLLGLQMPSGAYSGGTADEPPRPEVFNTGMILFGLTEAYRRTGQKAYREAAERAGAWLAEVQDPDGAWRQHTFQGIPHTYHTRVAWALLDLYDVAPEGTYREAAVRNLGWAAGQQQQNGWLALCAFEASSPPFTHTLAYALRGFLECGLILGDAGLVARATGPAERLMRRFEVQRFFGGTYDARWQTGDRYACLTGNAQFAHLWLRLSEAGGDGRFLNAALKMNDFVRSTQDLTSLNPGIRGGIKGSQPAWGAYLPFRHPNWAAKFFVDALMLEERVMRQDPSLEGRGEKSVPSSPVGQGGRGLGPLSVVLLTGRRRNPNAYPMAVAQGLRARGVEVRGVVFEEATRTHLLKLLRSGTLRDAAGRLVRRVRMLTLGRWRARRESGIGAPTVYLVDDLRRCGTPYVSVQDHNSRVCVETLRKWGPDLILLLGTRIVRAPVLGAARIGVINLHPGSLPDCRGVDTVEWALFEGRPLSVTAHFADRGVDTGPILVRRSFPAAGIRTIPEARGRIAQVAVEVAVEAVVGLQEGRVARMPQKRGEGRQYFAMHERLKEVVEKRLQQDL